MLVCNVSLRPPRTAITAAIAEAANADATASIFAVFDALVDDPAAAFEAVDATVGEFLIEAASATDTVGAVGSTFAVGVDEVATAADAPDGTTIGATPTRSAMIPRAFVNPSTSREANVAGTMVNL